MIYKKKRYCGGTDFTMFCDTSHHWLCPTPTPTEPETTVDICTLPMEIGTSCNAKYKYSRYYRYYYDSIKGKCKRFIYGGCDGNANNFRTKKACKATCVHK